MEAFGNRAVSGETLGFASPSHGGFALFEALLEFCARAARCQAYEFMANPADPL
jgi:hypothetical protein